MVVVIMALVAGFAPAASADSSDRRFVRTVMLGTFAEMDWEHQDFTCNWFNSNRRDFYRSIYEGVWMDEGYSYSDVRAGLYSALRVVC